MNTYIAELTGCTIVNVRSLFSDHDQFFSTCHRFLRTFFVGVYGYPSHQACPVALDAVREFLETSPHGDKVERIIFCLFLDRDVAVYEKLMPFFFPIEHSADAAPEKEEDDGEKEEGEEEKQ